MNALIDALSRNVGVTAVDMPATPDVLWQLIHDADKAAA